MCCQQGLEEKQDAEAIFNALNSNGCDWYITVYCNQPQQAQNFTGWGDRGEGHNLSFPHPSRGDRWMGVSERLQREDSALGPCKHLLPWLESEMSPKAHVLKA